MLEENQIGEPGVLGIDPELLEPVYRLPGVYRVVDHAGAGELYDACLRRLGRQEALCRRMLGRMADRLISLRPWLELGFVGLGDWSRERLGISGREVQSFARVARGLSSLPSVATAFEVGELSWTKVRILVTVATPETEEDWGRRTRWMTTRSLEDEVRRIAKGIQERGQTCPEGSSVPARVPRAEARDDLTGGGDTPANPTAEAIDVDEPITGSDLLGLTPAERVFAARKATTRRLDASALLDEMEITVDGEEKGFFRLRCARRVLLLWKEVIELARRMAGAQIPLWKAAEAIAAEGFSGAPEAAAGAADSRNAWNGCSSGFAGSVSAFAIQDADALAIAQRLDPRPSPG